LQSGKRKVREGVKNTMRNLAKHGAAANWKIQKGLTIEKTRQRGKRGQRKKKKGRGCQNRDWTRDAGTKNSGKKRGLKDQ